MDNSSPTNVERLVCAFNHLRMALASLDAANAPGHIGAHVDLAINQLKDVLPEQAIGPDDQIDTNAEPQ
jgi:hypothetical protein